MHDAPLWVKIVRASLHHRYCSRLHAIDLAIDRDGDRWFVVCAVGVVTLHVHFVSAWYGSGVFRDG